MAFHRTLVLFGLAGAALAAGGCSSSDVGPTDEDALTQNTGSVPSDDPARYDVDTTVDYGVRASEPQWLIP